MSGDYLDEFLSIAKEQENEPNDSNALPRKLSDTDLFTQESNIPNKLEDNGLENQHKSSLVHNGETDSSDDEDNKYFTEKKYSDYGQQIKELLSSTTSNQELSSKKSNHWKSKQAIKETSKASSSLDINTDTIFGIRVVNPLVSSKVVQERMIGRQSVNFSQIRNFIKNDYSETNWVISGVIVSKSTVKTSQKGTQFLVWTLSDLQNDIKIVSMFLFAGAYKEYWKTETGMVVGVLNPSVMEKNDDSKKEASLSVSNSQTIMILGKSKDFGTCKSMKKNGDKCAAVVNVNRCEYCIYHIKQEYQKMGNRADLQSASVGRGLTALRNKVLGKNELFYAGKSYMAIPAKKNRRLVQKDNDRLLSLSSNSISIAKTTNVVSKRKAATQLDVSQRQRKRDLELLQRLGAPVQSNNLNSSSSSVSADTSKEAALNVINKLKEKQNQATKQSQVLQKSPQLIPKLSANKNGFIDLDEPVTRTHINRAKLNALKYVGKNGPLTKIDPNNVKCLPKSVKRSSELFVDKSDNNSKKQKADIDDFHSQRFKKMMEASSIHTNLLKQRDDDEQEKYFHKLEVKEQMEEKMVNTFKVPCKAVRCLRCKYTAFSASELCKTEQHPLRVFDTVKRFFKCDNCQNRTVCLEVVPVKPCKNCGSGNWERTGMMKEKNVTNIGPILSIRGGEQTFINSVATNDTLNLLVPDD